MKTTLKALLGNRGSSDEQGSCGIRRSLLPGGEQRQFAVSQVMIKDARPHYHSKTWELYVIQKGQGVINLDGEPMAIKEGDVIEIPPMVVHQVVPDTEMTVLVIMSPYNAEKFDLEYV